MENISFKADDDLTIITDKLNNRLRKSLNYSTPNEIFNETLRG